MPSRGVCDRCGFVYWLNDLRKEWTGLMVCRQCFDVRHPQEFGRAVRDSQGVRPDVRPAPADVYTDHDGLTLLTSAATDISDSYWTKGRMTVTTGRDGPWGAVTAAGAFETTANNSHNVAKEGTISLATGTTYIMEAVAKSIGGRWLSFGIYNSDFSAGYNKNIYPTTGEVGDTVTNYGGLVTLVNLQAYPVGNDFYRCRLRFTVTAAAANANFYWESQQTRSSIGSFAGDTAKGLDFYSLGLYRVD